MLDYMLMLKSGIYTSTTSWESSNTLEEVN